MSGCFYVRRTTDVTTIALERCKRDIIKIYRHNSCFAHKTHLALQNLRSLQLIYTFLVHFNIKCKKVHYCARFVRPSVRKSLFSGMGSRRDFIYGLFDHNFSRIREVNLPFFSILLLLSYSAPLFQQLASKS